MILRKDINRISFLVALAVVAVGCRTYGLDSMRSASAPNVKSPTQGDPYAWGGIQEGTGGLVPTTKQTMETESATEAAYLQTAGVGGFVALSGWAVSGAKTSEIVGDYQPLPNSMPGEGHSGDHKEEGH
ncbi:MAG: hypothetical protein H7Y17_13875 [Chlorobia bacterium]|nr:hypothetical protein [Fimbriimonadaceae bacterium]